MALLLVTGTNGAKVRLTTDATICCNALMIQPYTGAGICYVGTSDMDPSTGVGVMAILLTTDVVYTFPQSQNGLNQLHPADFWVAGTVTGDKIMASYFVA